MNYAEFWQDTLASAVSFLPRLPVALLILLATPFIIRLLVKLMESTPPITRVNPSIITLLRSCIGFAAWILALAGVLHVFGFSQLAIVMGGSLALVVMSLAGAASGLVNDIIAGILLAADPDFNVGCTVEAAGTGGVVTSIDITRTRILADTGNLHIIPNRTLHAGNIVVINPQNYQGAP